MNLFRIYLNNGGTWTIEYNQILFFFPDFIFSNNKRSFLLLLNLNSLFSRNAFKETLCGRSPNRNDPWNRSFTGVGTVRVAGAGGQLPTGGSINGGNKHSYRRSPPLDTEDITPTHRNSRTTTTTTTTTSRSFLQLLRHDSGGGGGGGCGGGSGNENRNSAEENNEFQRETKTSMMFDRNTFELSIFETETTTNETSPIEGRKRAKNGGIIVNGIPANVGGGGSGNETKRTIIKTENG